MKRILLVDDHALVRKGLRSLLQEHRSDWTIGEAACADTACARFRSESWDLVIMDIELPGQNGLELVKRMRRELPKMPVLVLSVHDERRYGIRALLAGARGYISKTLPADQVYEAVEKILNGGRFVSQELAESLVSVVNGERTSASSTHDHLSDREFQIFRLLASGQTASLIARELCLSVKTVHTHRSRALRKMGLMNNAELTRYAFEHDLVD